jgi:transcriptional regulator with XRE-family HTH domain
MTTRVPPDDTDALVGVGKGAIGAAVKAARLRRRWPQRWLAFQAGVDQSIISRLENGKLTGIRWQTLARIVGVLQLGRGFRLPDTWDWAIGPGDDTSFS